jgi:hypothetical protein
MAANLKPSAPPLEQAVEQEFSILARRIGHHMMGTERGKERALAVASGLALAGWRVEVRSIDGLIEDPLVIEVWSEDA